MLQRILPAAMRGFLDKDIWRTETANQRGGGLNGSR
jgi:hypothetical protein